MSASLILHQLLGNSAARYPDRSAIEESDGTSLTYRQLNGLAARLRDFLRVRGVNAGERVGMCLAKSVDGVASIFGILKAGAAYVPCDPNAPATRNAFILADCNVKLAIVEERLAGSLKQELDKLGAFIPLFVIGTPGGGKALDAALHGAHEQPISESADALPSADDLAYILYTSGSTGQPKGVMLTQRNAVSFINWCSEVFEPTAEDRFSSHAPFHFDLSILDIYVPLRHGATLVLVQYELGKDPVRLAEFIDQKQLTVWYSAPSILSLMAQFGDLPSRRYEKLRTVLFAGEVFPIRHLRSLREQWPKLRFFNLYGPTETNVCTFHEIPERIPVERTEPYPIGKTCSHLLSRVVDASGNDIEDGSAGELCISGAAVTQGYWNRPEQTAKAFLPVSNGNHSAERKWYRTGDIVELDDNGDFIFRGRRDRMVKKRGYRVELGEIEACLYTHPSVRQAAVIPVESEEGLLIKAFVCGHESQKLSVIALKRYCSERLPLYMIPDVFSFPEKLPTTSTDKVDYEKLKQLT